MLLSVQIEQIELGSYAEHRYVEVAVLVETHFSKVGELQICLVRFFLGAMLDCIFFVGVIQVFQLDLVRRILLVISAPALLIAFHKFVLSVHLLLVGGLSRLLGSRQVLLFA